MIRHSYSQVEIYILSKSLNVTGEETNIHEGQYHRVASFSQGGGGQSNTLPTETNRALNSPTEVNFFKQEFLIQDKYMNSSRSQSTLAT